MKKQYAILVFLFAMFVSSIGFAYDCAHIHEEMYYGHIDGYNMINALNDAMSVDDMETAGDLMDQLIQHEVYMENLRHLMDENSCW